jgi:hypothetical protein
VLRPVLCAVTLAAGVLVAFPGTSQAATALPCDIYGAAGTPCVAAYSTVRALYAAYDGSLYKVERASDATSTNISALSAGGYADAAAQDSFCANTTCTITEIYDQSPEGNNLTIEGAGGNGAADSGASATALPAEVGGHEVYGVKISGQMGYRDDATQGVARNGQPEGMYMVTSGTYVNGGCCFDFGNAETNNNDNGNGHMDAINYGTECWFSPCYGSGPWVQADMEDGLFESNLGYSLDSSNTGTAGVPFVTAWLKNNGQNLFTLKYGNGQSGGLTTTYSGAEPSVNGGGYSPMHQEGAVVLGTGGDNSNTSIGEFFEGVMTSGYPTDAADNSVQADVVSAGYGSSTTTTTTTTTTTALATTTTTTTTTPGGGAACSASYTITSQWSGAFNWGVTVTAGSSALTSWRVTWTYANGQTVTDAWNATVAQSGSSVTAANMSYNGSLPAGQSTTFGGQGEWSGTNSAPTLSCT